MAENVPLQGKIFCCTLSFVGRTVFECEQTVRNLSYHGNTRKCAEFCCKSKKSPKNPVKNHVLGCRTFASTLVTLQICGLIIVVDVDLVTLASLSRSRSQAGFSTRQ